MLAQAKRPQPKAAPPPAPAKLPLKPATEPAMPMPRLFTGGAALERPSQKKQRKSCPACAAGGAACPKCQAKGAPTLERPPSDTQMRRGSPGEDPAERQADDLGKRIGDDLTRTESVGHGPLPKSVQQVAESHLGVSLDGTHIDAGSSGQRKAKNESALAVTEGKQVAFGEGQLSTSSAEGRALLGHELVHVGQQSRHDHAKQRQSDQSLPAPPASMTESNIVARIRELKGQAGRAGDVEQLSAELKRRCMRQVAKKMHPGDFLYSLADGVHYIPASAAIEELNRGDPQAISSCASAVQLAVETAFAKTGAPRLVSYSVAVSGTPEHVWLRAAQAGAADTVLREWGRAVAAAGAMTGVPGSPEPMPRPPLPPIPRPPVPAPEGPFGTPEVVPRTVRPMPGPETEAVPELLADLAAPFIAAIGVFLAIMLYAKPAGSRWATEINPITRRSYASEEEFNAVQAMSPEEIGAARRRVLAQSTGREDEEQSNCAETYPGIPECYEIDLGVGRGSAFGGYRDATPGWLLGGLKRSSGDANLRMEKAAIARAGPCANVSGSTHISVFDSLNQYVASIVCCPCCTDEPDGPMVENRCAVVEHT